jgi:serine/threonine-protein kinase HipA
MMRLDVWLTDFTGSHRHMGELAFTDTDRHGRYRSAFRYSAAWLSDPKAFALDPANLPLGNTEFTAAQLDPPLLAIDDALPDAWGRRLLILRHGLPRGQQGEPQLLRARAGEGLGALGFFAPGQAPCSIDTDADVVHLGQLADAARRLEAGEAVDSGYRALLVAGSSPGGARPKVLVRDAEGHWLAKFSSQRDRFDEVGLEATGLALGRAAGLQVPDFRLEPLAGGRRALLVRRFDLLPNGGRRHMLSFRALLGASGHYVLGYADLIAAMRRHAALPERDVPALFRQMVFNALLGNTDDHLKNFWILRDHAGWILSPAFDLLPDVGEKQEHVLLFGLSPEAPDRSALITLGRSWGISRAAAVVEEVAEAVAGFTGVATAYGVPGPEIARFGQDLERRLGARRPR